MKFFKNFSISLKLTCVSMQSPLGLELKIPYTKKGYASKIPLVRSLSHATAKIISGIKFFMLFLERVPPLSTVILKFLLFIFFEYYTKEDITHFPHSLQLFIS